MHYVYAKYLTVYCNQTCSVNRDSSVMWVIISHNADDADNDGENVE